MSSSKHRPRPRFPPPRRRAPSLSEVFSFDFTAEALPEEPSEESNTDTPPSPEWPVATVDSRPSLGCFPFPGSVPQRRYSVALPAQHPGSFLLPAPVQVEAKEPSPRLRSRRRSEPATVGDSNSRPLVRKRWELEDDGIEEAVRAWRRRRRVTGLVDQLLIEIYGLWGGREGTSRLPSKGPEESSDYLTEWSTTSGGMQSSSSCAYQKGEALDSLRKARLRGKDVGELLAMVATLEENVNYSGSLLVRQLKKRDALISKRDRHCDLITAILQAVSEKRSQDTRMRFSVVPPPPGDSGFEQWRDAMRMVARLPGGIPPEFRRRLWLTLAEKHLQSRGVDWSKAERMCLNEWRHPDDEELGIQIVKDLHRTGCSLFCGGTEGAAANQAVLKRVLLGFARWNKAVGYCQGFNMLAALILQVTERSEADAIKVMIFLIEGVLPEGYFADHLRGLSVDMAVFRDLLRLRLPALSRHLEALQHDARDSATGAVYEPPLTNVFTMQWFLTLFCNCLPRAAVLRVWDLVFLEGSEVVLRTALAIWDGLQDRIMAVGSADEFYSIMGVLTREMLEFGLMDSNNLIKAIVSMGPFPFPGLAELRDRHLYNITPWSRSVSAVARRGFGRIFYADEEEEEEEEDEEEESGTRWGNRRSDTSEREAGERLAVATAFGLSAVFRSPRRRDSHPPGGERGVSSRLPWVSGPGPSSGSTSAPLPTTVDRERLSLDVWALRQQYSKLRERQRQAHVILTAACARQMGPSPSAPSHGTAVNHLLLGKSALLPPRGRRRGPPPGSVPAPLRRIHPPPPAKDPPSSAPPPLPPEESGETLLWKDAKKLQGKSRRDSDSGSTTLSPLKEAEEAKQELPEVVDDQDKEKNETEDLNWDKNSGRERRGTYSSDSGSSSSTELCDDDAAHLSDLDSSAEGVSPVPVGGTEEDDDRVFSPPKTTVSEGELPSLKESPESQNPWESIGTEDTTSKEGRLSSSTITPGNEDAPFSPQDTTDFKLPELYLPPISPSTSTHVAPSTSPLKDSNDPEKSPKSSLNNFLLGSPQHLTPASSTTTSSASEPSPSTTSSPGPIVSSTSSPISSPHASLPLVSPPFSKTGGDESNDDTFFQISSEKPEISTALTEDMSSAVKKYDSSWMDICAAEPDSSVQSPPGIESLLKQWSHLDTQKWEGSIDTPLNETKENSPTPQILDSSIMSSSPNVSLSQPLSTTQSIFTSTYSTLLPSTSVSIPIIPSTSNSPQSMAMYETPLFLSSSSPPPLLGSMSSAPPIATPSPTNPPLNFSSQPSPPLYTPSRTPSPLLPSLTASQALFTVPSMPPLYQTSSPNLPPLPPSTIPPPYIPTASTQPPLFTSSSLINMPYDLTLTTTVPISTSSLSPLSFKMTTTTSVPFSMSPETPLSFPLTTASTLPYTTSPLSPQSFHHITTTSVSSNMSPCSPINFQLTMSTTVASTTSPSTPLSFHPTMKYTMPSTTSPSSPVSFHPTLTTAVSSSASPVCPLTFYPTSSTTLPFITSSSSPLPFHSSLSSSTQPTTLSTTPPSFHSTLSTPPTRVTVSSTTPLYQTSVSTTSSLIPLASHSPHVAPSPDAASVLEMTSHQSSTLSITSKPMPSSSMLPDASTSTHPLKPYTLPPLPLHPTFPLTCDTNSTAEDKQKDQTTLPLNWDWLPGESNILKKPKSGSSPSSLLASPVGVSSRTITEGNIPSSPPKNSQNLAPRRHSERALRIIQENSEILQRMLRHPPPPSPPSPVASFATLPERLHHLEGDVHQALEGVDRSPHSPASPASSSWPLDISTDVSASASSKSPATSPVALGDVISWGMRRGTFAMPLGGTLPSPPVTSPMQPFNPFPQRPTWRQPKELGVKLGLYSSASSPSPPVTHPKSSPLTPTSPSKSSSAYLKQTFK